MNVSKFFTSLIPTYYAWGTIVAYPRNAEHYCAILDTVQGMTTPSTMHLLNTAVSCMAVNECYLECGTWRGATFIGALAGHDGRHGYAIDDDSMDDHDEDARASADVWAANVSAFGLSHRAHYINGVTPAVWERERLTDGRPVGVYFYDGPKATPEDALGGLRGVVPLLAEKALIVVDDVNVPAIRIATTQFVKEHFDTSMILMDMPTPGNCWPGFWDGFQIIGWSRSGVE